MTRLRLPSPSTFLLTGVALLAAVVFAAWTLRSDDFLYVATGCASFGT